MQTEKLTDNVKKVLVYCRVSSIEQIEGYSLDTQEKFCKKFADDNNFEVAEIFRDEGKSGTNLDRPALQDMLAKCQDGENKYAAVLVQETDRLARNTKDHLTIRALLKKAEVKLISVAQPMLDSSPEGIMVDTILASVNQFQSDINSRKTQKGMQARFDTGWYPSLAKLGYLNQEVNGDKIIVNDPERWLLVQEGLKIYLQGNCSAMELADMLYEKGLTSRQGKKICNGIMLGILKNPFYAGIMEWNGQKKIGNHQPMITEDEHKQILTIMAAHNQHACRRRVHNFLLRGFAFCGICNQRYTAERHRKEKFIDYYHCAAKVKKHSNEGQNIEIGKLEKMVEEKFKGIQFSQRFIDLIVRSIKKFHKNKTAEGNKNKLALLNRKIGLERKREVAESKLIAGTLTDNGFLRVRDKLEAEIASVQKQIYGLEHKHNIDIDVVRQVLALTRNIGESYKKASPEVKRLYLSLFWEGFWVKDKQIIEAKPTKLMENLVEEKSVIISATGLRW